VAPPGGRVTLAATVPWAPLLEPEAVAVIGASEQNFYARNAIQRLQRTTLAARTHLVNPNRDSAFGLPCVPQIGDVEEAIDLAIVVVRADRTAQALRECAAAGVRAAIVVADRIGNEAELREIAMDSGMRVLGPSSLGVLNVARGLELFAGGDWVSPRPGNIGVVSQSGGLLITLAGESDQRALGFTRLVAVGGGACTSVEDVIEHFVEDDETEVICALAEELRDPERFVRAAAAAAEGGKLLAILKLGRSEATARLAVTHTGALTGDDAFYDALFADLGVTRVTSLEEMLDTVCVHAATPRRFRQPVTGVAIVSLSGGIAGVAADLLAPTLIDVPDFGKGNPLELGRQIQKDHPETWPNLLDAIAADDRLDALLVIDLGLDVEKATSLARWREETGKLVVLADNGPGLTKRDAAALDLLHALALPSPLGPASAVRGLVGCAPRDAGAAGELLAPRRPRALDRGGRDVLTDADARRLFAEHGIASPREHRASSVEGAVAAAEELGFPVVVKTAANDVTHRTELGLVRVGLRSADDVAAAAAELLPHGELLVQELVRGVELILSVDNTRGHAPLVLVGRGGELVELEQDRALAVGPVGRVRAQRLVDRLATAPVLHGYRGKPPADLDALCAAIEALSRFAFDAWDDVAVAEINPLVVRAQGEGAIAVDGLVELR
jgi:acetate---CoA ligase (ADP-forming)